MESRLDRYFKFLKTASSYNFPDDELAGGKSWPWSNSSYYGTANILQHLKITMLAENDIIHTLDTVHANVNELKAYQKKQEIKLNEQPLCLENYIKKSADICKINLQSILADLQYHLGLISSPGTNNQLSSFKEKNLFDDNREKNYDYDVLKRFLAADNEGHALVAICLNEGVKANVCLLAVHKDVVEAEKNRCIKLLAQSEVMTPAQNHANYLARYQLSEIEKLFFNQQKIQKKQINKYKKENKMLIENIQQLQQKTDKLQTQFDLFRLNLKLNKQTAITPQKNIIRKRSFSI